MRHLPVEEAVNEYSHAMTEPIPPQLPTIVRTLTVLLLRVFVVAVIALPLIGLSLTKELLMQVEQARYWNVPAEMVNRSGAQLPETLPELMRQLRLFAPYAKGAIVSPDGVVIDADGSPAPRRLSDLEAEHAPFLAERAPKMPVMCTNPYAEGSALCLLQKIPGDTAGRSVLLTLDPVLLHALHAPHGRPLLWLVLALGALGTAFLIGGSHVLLVGGFRRQHRALMTMIMSFRPGSPLPDVPLSRFDELSTVGHEAHRLLRILKDTGEADEHRERGRREFFANIVHDLRSPVTAIRGQLELANDKGATDDEAVSALRRCLGSQRQLVGALTALAAPVLDRTEPAIERVVLTDILRAIKEKNEPRALTAGISLECASAQDELAAELDPALIERAVQNLVGNALRYTPRGGTVSFAIRRLKGEIVFEVRDTGAGISAEELPLVFERTYRAQIQPSGEEKRSGAGLGLAIVRRIAEMHGGTAQVESTVGSGSTFSISIPEVRETGGFQSKTPLPPRAVRDPFRRSAELSAIMLRHTAVAIPLIILLAALPISSGNSLAWLAVACVFSIMFILPTWTEPSYEDGWKPAAVIVALGLVYAAIFYLCVPLAPRNFGAFCSVVIGSVAGLAFGRVFRAIVPWGFLVPVFIAVTAHSLIPDGRPEVRVMLFLFSMLITGSRQLIVPLRTNRFHRRTLLLMGISQLVIVAIQLFAIFQLTTRLVEVENGRNVSALSASLAEELRSHLQPDTGGYAPAPNIGLLKELARLMMLDPGIEVLLALPTAFPSDDVWEVYSIGSFFTPVRREYPHAGEWGMDHWSKLDPLVHAAQLPVFPGSSFWRIGVLPHGTFVNAHLRKLHGRTLVRAFVYMFTLLLFAELLFGGRPLKRIARASDKLVGIVRGGASGTNEGARSVDILEFQEIALALETLRGRVAAERAALNAKDSATQRLVADLATVASAGTERSEALLESIARRKGDRRRESEELYAETLAQHRFLDRVFDFARLAAPRGEREGATCDLVQTMYEAILTAASEGVEAPGVEFECDEEIRVVAQEPLLLRTLVGMLGLAREVSSSSGPLRVDLRREGEIVRVRAGTNIVSGAELSAAGDERELTEPGARLALRLLMVRAEALGGAAALGGASAERAIIVTLPSGAPGDERRSMMP